MLEDQWRDPNAPRLDWKFIQQVVISLQDTKGCCICLEDTFEFPRVSACGHLFCLACILSYLKSDLGKGSGSCPICGEQIQYKELRLVYWYTEEEELSDKDVFFLFKRLKNCNLILPAELNEVPSFFTDLKESNYFPYMKYVFVEMEEVQRTYQQEILQIESKLKQPDASPIWSFAREIVVKAAKELFSLLPLTKKPFHERRICKNNRPIQDFYYFYVSRFILILNFKY